MANIKNTVFFKTLRSAFALDPTLNYAIRPTILYFTQYQKSLDQHTVAEKDWSEDIINFTSSIKPYHVRFDATVEKIFSKVDPVQITITDDVHDKIQLNFENVIREPQLLGFDKRGYDWERGPSDMSLVSEYNPHYATQDLYNTSTGVMGDASDYPELPIMKYGEETNYIYNEGSKVWIPYEPVSDGEKMIGGQWGYYAIADAEATQTEDPRLGSFDSIAKPNDISYLATVSKISELDVLRDLFNDDFYFRNLANLTYFSKGWDDTERVVNSIGNNYKGNRIIDYFYTTGYDADVLNEDQFDTSVYEIDYCIDGDQYGELEQEDEFIVRKNISRSELESTDNRLDKLPIMNGTKLFTVREYNAVAYEVSVPTIEDPDNKIVIPALSYTYLEEGSSYIDHGDYITLTQLPPAIGRYTIQIIYYDIERKEDTTYFDKENYTKKFIETFNNAVYRSKGSEQLDFAIKDSFVIEERQYNNLFALHVVDLNDQQYRIELSSTSTTIAEITRNEKDEITSITVTSDFFSEQCPYPYIPEKLYLAEPGQLYCNGMLIDYWERDNLEVLDVKLHSLGTVSIEPQVGDTVYLVMKREKIETAKTAYEDYEMPNWLTNETAETLDYPNDRDTYSFNIPLERTEFTSKKYEVLVWTQDVVQIQTYDVTRNGQNVYLTYSKNVKLPYIVNNKIIHPGELVLENQTITFTDFTNSNNTTMILRDVSGVKETIKKNDYVVVQNFSLLDPSYYTVSDNKVIITKKFIKPVRVRIQVVYIEENLDQ